MEIKVLGSVSPYPKGNMNCPSFLVTNGDNKILLDSGPGSSRLLDVYHDLKNLTIFISHYHADHYSDLFAISYMTYLANRLGIIDERVKVYLPKAEEAIFKGFKIDETGKPRYISPPIAPNAFIKDKDRENFLEYIDYDIESQIKIGDMNITFSKNPHSIDSYATKIQSDEGTIVYSGDTGFKNNTLIDFAKDADILLCEATFLKGQFKNEDVHLYAFEAAKIASLANVKNLYLFHTFPEINKEDYVREAKEIFESTYACYEGEVIKLRKER